MNEKEYPAQRSLDGVYFRVERNGKWCNVCFSDLTESERCDVMTNRSDEWLKSMCNILADCLRDIGNEFDIIAE